MSEDTEKRKDWSLLDTWCENQADLEETESWMCAPAGERQEWEGAASFYKHFASAIDQNALRPEQIQSWLSGARQAANRISERVDALATASPDPSGTEGD